MVFQYLGNPAEGYRTVNDYMRQADSHRLSQRLGDEQIQTAQSNRDVNAEKIKQAKMERAKQYLDMATPENWGQVRTKAIQEGFGDESLLPQQYDENWITQAKGAFSDSSKIPSSIQEYNFYKKLQPIDQEDYIKVKRTNPYINLGDRMVRTSPIDNSVIDSKEIKPKPEDMPDFKFEQEKAKQQGKEKAEAIASAPDFLAKATQIKKNVQDLISHPGFETSVGAKGISRGFGLTDMLGGAVPGTDAADFDARLEQVKGQQFLQAFETLKGGGQITEVEGAKATAAISRMNKAQSETEFKAAAEEFTKIVDDAMNRARSKAGISISNTTSGQSANVSGVTSYQDYFK